MVKQTQLLAPGMVPLPRQLPKDKALTLLEVPPAHPAASQDPPAWFGMNKSNCFSHVLQESCRSWVLLVAHQGLSDSIGSVLWALFACG